MYEYENPHGGKRKGAGRPPLLDSVKRERMLIKALKKIHNIDLKDKEGDEKAILAQLIRLFEDTKNTSIQKLLAEHLIGTVDKDIDITSGGEPITIVIKE